MMPRVRFMDLGPQTRAVREEVLGAWNGILERGAFSGGDEVAAFERAFAEYLGAAHVVGCSDGTMALVLLLRAAGIGPGDEVLTAPTSFFATAEAIVHAGARPVFADVEYETGNLDPERVELALTERVRAVIAVHLGGRPAEMEQLREIASREGVMLFEDAAQAHGALYRGRKAGTLADGAGFSFYPTKNLGAFGEAGAVAVPDAEAAERLRALRDHGQTTRHRHVESGYNARLDPLQAAVLRSKLPHLDRWIAERRAIAAQYRRELEGLPLGLPKEGGAAEPVYHLFTVRTPERDRLRDHLAARGIETGSHYPTPMHLQAALASLGHEPGDFPNAERYAAHQLSLPLYPGLAAEAVAEVAGAIRAFFKG
jgi:dTDP-4-amino-4,6-dideoxygalactose transaminase